MPCTYPLSLLRRKGQVIVPCGTCENCLIARTRDWATRAELEGRLHSSKCFATLTYRTSELIWGQNWPTLYPSHLTLFWKRLRKEYGAGIKYLVSGEYGERGYRPHYHAIIFGVDFSDKIPKGSRLGNQYYHSATLDSIWSHGECIIGDVTPASAAYVARYILAAHQRKKQKIYAGLGVMPEFNRMSRRPGIGANWLLQNIYNVYPWDNVITNGNVKNKVPRYFDKLLSKIDEDELLGVKLDRKTKSNKYYKTQSQLNSIHKITLSKLKILKTIL